ncbi:flagellar basal body P-ring formation chaperone FlgA [Falsiroseomonas tokyonensis]|uniref:Flagellar basal body P-ring formation chaperone FlgA n=1 Tax=Falsiroseomonas tokyonensis TaxID=430521 RepID=A0ABV7BSL4_9PROT|nr:flagellar basal body P-ring formation chaperone FlgA [Falsiroseomonas tokyonensis]MBU8537661.1 flagellar basal body P-ring formation protein FlgA [Falsiroseomonas tokyonensis]
MRILPLLLLAFAQPALAQEMARLRPFAMVEDATVKLEDLFEGLGARGATPLGPAPAPGQQLVVEAAQLAAIARRNNIAWRPSGGADRVVLDRPGRALAREDVMEPLRIALRAQGAEEEAELELQAFNAPLIPAAAFPQVAVEQVVFDPATQRFGASLAVMAEGMATQRLRVAGRAVVTAEMLVAARRLAAGEVLQPEDVRLQRVAATQLRPGVASRVDQAVGQALRRPAAPGQPLMMVNLSQPLVVERGSTVTMQYDIPGLAVTAQGRAMEGAARGALVPVMNLGSRIVVEARVIGPGRVRVESRR